MSKLTVISILILLLFSVKYSLWCLYNYIQSDEQIHSNYLNIAKLFLIGRLTIYNILIYFEEKKCLFCYHPLA